MKTLSLVIDTSTLNLGEEEKKMNPVELVSNVITNCVLTYSQQVRGLSKTQRYQVYEIDEKLKEAIINKSETIELEDKTSGFLREVFREAKLTPNNLLKLVEKNIDAIKDR